VPAGGPGGAFAAVVDGRTVVDLWAGTADRQGRPWRRDTAAVVFSGTRGVVATAVLLLVERGVRRAGRRLTAGRWRRSVAQVGGAGRCAGQNRQRVAPPGSTVARAVAPLAVTR
jgi:hypothetical protein